MQLTELFSGLGGVAEAVRQINASSAGPATPIRIVSAIEIDRDCCDVYQHNFGTRVVRRTIESLEMESLEMESLEMESLEMESLEIGGDVCFHCGTFAEGPDAWWLSPPCQPY